MNQSAQADIPSLHTVYEYLSYYAESRPTTQALICDALEINYTSLHSNVRQCAKSLIASGIGKGDRVATLSTPHPDFFTIFLAAGTVGAIWLGLNPRYQLPEYRYVIGDSLPKLVFARARIGERDYSSDLNSLQDTFSGIEEVITLGSAPQCNRHTPSYAEFLKRGDSISDTCLDKAISQVDASDPALIVYTSGSTGKPKGALLPHRGLTRCSITQLHYWPANPVRVINFLPINHIGCVGDIACYALVAGGTIVFMEQFDSLSSLKLIESRQITVWGGVPTTLQMCLAEPLINTIDLSSIQLIVWSGASASEETIRQLREICPRLSNAYGMTETVGSVTFVPITDDIDILTNTVGRPVTEYELRLCDSSGADVQTKETGEIMVRGDFIMKGYWNREEATAEAINPEGWLHTGDLAIRRDDGNLQLVGRISEMYKSGGYNVYPREVEQVIESLPEVESVAVLGVADALYSEVGYAFVILKSGTSVTEEELRRHCSNSLANYKIPKKFFIENTLPLLPIGKIDKMALKRKLIEQEKTGRSGP